MPMPLAITVCPDSEKMVVGYDSNKIMVFDIHNKCLHPWTRANDSHFPQNFLKRFNKFVGATALSSEKFLFYTNYTYTILDITKPLDQMSEVKIIQDHPGKTLDSTSTWFEYIKKSQSKYLDRKDIMDKEESKQDV